MKTAQGGHDQINKPDRTFKSEQERGNILSRK